MPLRIPSPDRFPSLLSRLLRPAVWLYFLALLFLSAAGAFLWKSGEMLLSVDPPLHTHWAVVLAGEERDFDRLDAALALFQQGLFDSVILSGPRIFKTHYISEYSSAYLISRGFPKERVFQLPTEGQSTAEEADMILGQVRRLGVDTLLIITSDYHTARVSRIYRKLADGFPEVRLSASQGVLYDPKAWWASRDSRETWVLEWIKTLNTAWESKRLKPLVGMPEMSFLLPDPRAERSEEENSHTNTRFQKTRIPPDTAQKILDSSKSLADSTHAIADSAATQ